MQVNAILILENLAPWAPMVGRLSLKKKELSCLAGIEVFGKPVASRIIEALRDRADITVIHGAASPSPIKERGVDTIIVQNHDGDREIAFVHAVQKLVKRNAGTTLIARLGAYVEFDLERALQVHASRGQGITPIHDKFGCLHYWLVDTNKLNKMTPSSFLSECEVELGLPFVTDGYVNRLEDAHDLRRLIVDSFLGRCAIRPRGREIRPGVWIDGSAHLHRSARVVAPVYIGNNTTVESTAVITRFTNLENHCHIGAGSLVSDASVLPHTTIGNGLDISGAVVDGCEFVDLDRNVALTIGDPNLIAEAASARSHAPALRFYAEKSRQDRWRPEVEYSQYLTRAAGRFFEAFKGEA